MTCIKCGCRHIAGPTFRCDAGLEYLEYKCLMCNYSWTGPTKDAGPPVGFAGLPDHLQPRGGSDDV
jgi:hypothetical protein